MYAYDKWFPVSETGISHLVPMYEILQSESIYV